MQVAAELPDIATVPPDLTVPEMTEGAPAAGLRVRHTTAGWEKTEVYGALYLPPEWKPGARFPVIVEWAGNGGYKNAFGDISTGRPEGSKLGYGLTEGKGAIWLCVPYLNHAGSANALTWWGDAPSYDPEPTLAYCRAAVREVCEKYGGDASRVVLAGFSRGAIACNYLGLHDDETAKLWRGFIAYSHYDGVRKWPYPDSDRASAAARLQRLGTRPQFICGEAEQRRRHARLSQRNRLAGERRLHDCGDGLPQSQRRLDSPSQRAARATPGVAGEGVAVGGREPSPDV